MTIHLDHAIVPSHNQIASAKLLAELLNVPWAATSIGQFSPVYLNDGLTLDFQETDETFPVYHFCFRVSQADFDAILERIKTAGIKYRSTLGGVVDMRVDPLFVNEHWNEPPGHQWEMLTVSYARASR